MTKQRRTRLKGRRQAEKLAAELLAIGRRCAKMLEHKPEQRREVSVLYDERGIPR